MQCLNEEKTKTFGFPEKKKSFLSRIDRGFFCHNLNFFLGTLSFKSKELIIERNGPKLFFFVI